MKRSIFLICGVFLLGVGFGVTVSESRKHAKFSSYEKRLSILDAEVGEYKTACEKENLIKGTENGLIRSVIDQAAMLLFFKENTGFYPESGMLEEGKEYSKFKLTTHLSDSLGRPYYFDRCVVLFSSGLDGELGTDDDIGVRVESFVVTNTLEAIPELAKKIIIEGDKWY